MDPNEFQELSLRTMPSALSWHDRHQMVLLGICGEVGEVIDFMKKNIFHGHEIDQSKLTEELGDVSFYAANLCSLYGAPFSDVADADTTKDWDSAADMLIRLHLATAKVCGNLLLSEENGTKLEEAMPSLGMAMGYLKVLARGNNIEMGDVYAANVKKLDKRYPEGFDPARSRNRSS